VLAGNGEGAKLDYIKRRKALETNNRPHGYKNRKKKKEKK